MYMPWLPEYDMGVAEIDVQHKEFVSIINDLDDAINIGSEDVVLGDILHELFGYASFHFATEEKYFDKFDYELADEHKKQHEAIRNSITTFLATYEMDVKKNSRDLLEFLKKWFMEHTQGHDRKYVECFHDNGLE
jgi:hemerythrin